MRGAASQVRVGCAGWTLPASVQDRFPPADSHLQRYAQVFGASEINSTFHRPHRRSTYERWAASVPAGFVFSAKLPKAITHAKRLVDCGDLLRAFFDEAAPLGSLLRCVLVQLPPSLAFDEQGAAAFFAELGSCFGGLVAVEPRHASWFVPDVDTWLAHRQVARVLADPVRHAGGEVPGGWGGLVYLRLHGTPRTYYSSYQPELLDRLSSRLRKAADDADEVWCIFDNTAGQAAAGNALDLLQRLDQT